MKTFFIYYFLLICTISCSTTSEEITESGQPSNNGSNQEGNNGSNPQSTTWSIPVDQVIDGGPGKDGIPALVNPKMVSAEEVSVLRAKDLVLAFKDGDDIRAYPHIILDWHEIINDRIGDVSLAVTFCPLTGTGIGWGRMINGTETTFGVSGLLYNTNLIPYDRLTDSNWSQILNESVNGELIGEKPKLYQLLELDWNTLKRMYPNVRVVSTDTPFPRTYGTSPYGDYNTNNERFLFPVAKDRRLPLKERVLAILDGQRAKVYQFSNFQSEHVIRDTFRGKEYLLIGNKHFMTAFRLRNNELKQLAFTYSFNTDGPNPDVILEDNEGNQWNVFGEAVAGPRKGEFLDRTDSMMGQWFSIPAFYTTEIYSK